MRTAATPGVLPVDAVARRVSGEGVLLLGGGRALLMQLAHPLVAQGVADHSGFAADPFARLQRTLDAMYTVVYGTEAEARVVAAQVRAVHDRVTGAGYQANDPELLLWVHATLVDTSLRVYRRFLGPLPPGDAERYYAESMIVGEVLGVPQEVQPPDLAAFTAYVGDMVRTLAVGDVARRLASAILHPAVPPLAAPLFEIVRQVTVGLLPPPLRAGYGLRWDPARAAAFDAASVAARQVLPRLPRLVRAVPSPATRDRLLALMSSH